jgi:hypothetical protein
MVNQSPNYLIETRQVCALTAALPAVEHVPTVSKSCLGVPGSASDCIIGRPDSALIGKKKKAAPLVGGLHLCLFYFLLVFFSAFFIFLVLSVVIFFFHFHFLLTSFSSKSGI